MATNSAEEVAAGVWLVRFLSKETLTAEACAPILPALIKASERQPIVLMGALPPDTTLIPAGLVPFWLNAIVLKGLRIRAIGVVTTSRAVRVVVSGFQSAMRLRSHAIGAETRATEAELIAWAKEYVKTSPEH